MQDDDCFIEFEQNLPEPVDRELLVKVKAVSVNPVDTKIRKVTKEIQTPPKVLGRDAAGVVEAVSLNVTLFKPGDKVFYSGNLKKTGSNAAFQIVDERLVGKHPEKLSFAEAAAMPLTALTAWESLFDRLKIDIQKDRAKNILIIGGAGGVGSISIQIAKKVAELNVTASASRSESAQWCKKMGADNIVNHYELLMEYESKKLPAPDFILCCSDTDSYFDQMAQLIAPQGMICVLVDTVQNHNLLPLKAKSAGIVWEFMATRPIFETGDMAMQHHYLNRISELLDQGILQSTLTLNLGLMSAQNLRKAHHLIESGKTIGKIVLEGF